jgi:hypothetical protein
MAEVAVSRQMFADILSLIARQRAPPCPHERGVVAYSKETRHMENTHKITENDWFEIKEDDTFQINVGTITLVFEITKEGPKGRRLVHLKSPEKALFAVSTDEAGVGPMGVSTRGSDETGPGLTPDYREIINRAVRAATSKSIEKLAFVRHIDRLDNLNVELLKANEMQNAAKAQFGSNPDFVFVLNNEAHPLVIADARKKLTDSGLNADLMVRNAEGIY